MILCRHCRRSYRLDRVIAFSTEDRMGWLTGAGVSIMGSPRRRPVRVGHSSNGPTDLKGLDNLLGLYQSPSSKWTCHECGSDNLWAESFLSPRGSQ
jgi:hypothetical protein